MSIRKVWARPGVRLGVKAGFVTGLFYLMGKKGFLSLSATAGAFERWDLLLAGLACSLAATLLTTARWRTLLGLRGFKLPLLKVLELALIGTFFNLALPGAVSGDFVKAYYVGKKATGQRALAFSSIFFDRIMGLSGLVLLSSSAMALGYSFSEGSSLFDALKVLLLASGTGVAVFYGYLFWASDHWDPLMIGLKRLEKRFPKASALRRVYEGVTAYGKNRGTVLGLLLLSVLVHALVVLGAYFFLSAILESVPGHGHVNSFGLFIVVPLGLLVTAVPVLPGGVGTGHYAFLTFFQLLGTDRGADVFSLYLLVQAVIGSVGGFIYLRHRAELPPAPALRGATS